MCYNWGALERKGKKMLELLKELKLEFVESKRGVGAIDNIISLIEQGYIPVDCDVYVVSSRSIINGWASPAENSKYYRLYVELANKDVGALVNIEHHDVDLLMKLYRTLMLFKLK